MNKQRFQRISGVYTCSSCKHLTRETGGGESDCGLCLACYELAGIYNTFQDCGPEEVQKNYSGAVQFWCAKITGRGQSLPGDFQKLLEIVEGEH